MSHDRRVNRIHRIGLLALALAGCADPAPRAESATGQLPEDSTVSTTQRVRTENGVMTIDEVRYGDGSSRSHVLRVDGRALHAAELTTGMSVDTVWETPAFAPDASVALVGENPGGNACFVRYRIVTLRAGQAPVLSDEFGSCMPPDSTWMRDGALRMRFPRWQHGTDTLPPGPPATWTFRGGQRVEEEGR
jgi:hypothetical protein